MIYENDECSRFLIDMRIAGYPVEHYLGRLCYEGPAVRVEKWQCVMVEKKTTVQLQHHEENGKVVLYPIRCHNSPNIPFVMKKIKKEIKRRKSNKWVLTAGSCMTGSMTLTKLKKQASRNVRAVEKQRRYG